MKKIMLMAMMLSFAGLLTCWPALAADPDKDFTALKSDLQKRGVSSGELNEAQKPIKEMLARGTSREELRGTLEELTNNGVKGRDLRETMESMNDLEKSGESAKDAGNIVSKAVHEAQSQGLKGTALAAKVHAAINVMQTEKTTAREMRKTEKANRLGTETRSSAAQGTDMGHVGGGLGNMGGGMGHMGGGMGHGGR